MRNIEYEHFCRTVIESAAAKGACFKPEEITPEVADFLRQYDWVVALWPDASKEFGMGALEIINTGKEAGFMRCNSIPCVDERTARKLKTLCDKAARVSGNNIAFSDSTC